MKKEQENQTDRPENWHLKPPYTFKTFIVCVLLAIVLVVSGKNMEIPKMLSMSTEWAGNLLGIVEDSKMGDGINRFLGELFPPAISDEKPIARIENFDAGNLPLLARVENKEVKEFTLDPNTFEMVETVTTEKYLVEPLGYLKHVGIKMLETLEIGLWGTVLAIILSIPLAILSARNYTWNWLSYTSTRSVVSLFRAIPELISALILVIAFGFGPIPGILALGIHCAGFLGKFYAEDIENADKGPQDALFAIGSSKLKTLWFAVIPQVLPQYIAYTLYILDRNVRMAAVVGIVGAGGIGLELKGRFEMFHYSHVGTILIVLFITVLLLDQISAKIRKNLIN
jgi:phosphonate transport system permease protein